MAKRGRKPKANKANKTLKVTEQCWKLLRASKKYFGKEHSELITNGLKALYDKEKEND